MNLGAAPGAAVPSIGGSGPTASLTARFNDSKKFLRHVERVVSGEHFRLCETPAHRLDPVDLGAQSDLIGGPEPMSIESSGTTPCPVSPGAAATLSDWIAKDRLVAAADGGSTRHPDLQGPGHRGWQASPDSPPSASPTGRASVWLVGSETEDIEQADSGDAVGVADADDPAWELLPAGEVIGFGAAQVERAGGGHQVDGGGGAQLGDGYGVHVSLLASRAVVGANWSDRSGTECLDVLAIGEAHSKKMARVSWVRPDLWRAVTSGSLASEG
jgi:hypothetical protein